MTTETLSSLHTCLAITASVTGWDIEDGIWSKDDEGRNVSRIGAMFIEKCNTSLLLFRLIMIANIHGGEKIVSPDNVTADEMRAWLEGVRDGYELKAK